jgi:hypothetical protein
LSLQFEVGVYLKLLHIAEFQRNEKEKRRGSRVWLNRMIKDEKRV